ncbi:AAA family ATPase [Glutamicibacter uratoxydans]|uniref:AAA family ATPase n=1 Tax=Glutamicibacter uratoxydans TaxID=43667 RepID=UPI003D6EF34C
MRSRKNLLTTLLGKISGPRDAAVLLCGAPGSGKSWMLDQLSQRLGNQPHSYLRTSALESNWPLSGLLMLLANVPLSSPIDLEEFLPARPVDEVDSYAVARYLQQVLPERLAPGTVVLLDDIDLMDPASLKVISFLATKLQRMRTRFVGSLSLSPVPAELSALSQLHLPELTEAEALNLSAEHAGPRADRSVLRMVTDHSHGIPGRIFEQLELLSARQRNGQGPLCLPLQPTEDYRSILPSKLAGLSDHELRLLRLAAMGPRPDLQALAGANIWTDSINELVYRGLLEPVEEHLEFRDPAIRSAVYWSLSTEERRGLHQYLERSSSDLALKLFHQSFADDAEVSAVELIAHGRQLVNRGDVSAALELIERALNLRMLDTHLPELLTGLAHDLLDAAALEAAQRYLNFAEHLAPVARTELAIATLRVRIAAVTGHTAPLIDTHSLVRTHQAQYPVACGQLLSAEALAHAIREDAHAARASVSAAASLLEGADEQDSGLLTQAQLILASLEMDYGQLLKAYQEMLTAAQDQAGVEIRQALVIGLLNIGYHHEAREILARLSPSGAEPTRLSQQVILLLSAANAIQNENLPRAMTLVERWVSAQTPALLEPLPQLIQAWYWMTKNRQDMADAFFESMQPRVIGELSPKLLGRISMLAGDNALMLSQPQRALQAYRDSLQAYGDEADIRYVLATTHLIEALLLLGRTQQAAVEYHARYQQMSMVPGRRAKLTIRLAQALVLQGSDSIARFQALLAQWTVKGHWFLPTGGHEKCPPLANKTAR